MITYIVSFTFKMMTPCCQQYSVVKTQAHLRLMKVIIDYTEQTVQSSIVSVLLALGNRTSYYDNCRQISTCLTNIRIPISSFHSSHEVKTKLLGLAQNNF